MSMSTQSNITNEACYVGKQEHRPMMRKKANLTCVEKRRRA
jgi:hypothetical protein